MVSIPRVSNLATRDHLLGAGRADPGASAMLIFQRIEGLAAMVTGLGCRKHAGSMAEG